MKVTVNGFGVEVPQGTSLFKAVEATHFTVPTYCNPNEEKMHPARCGMCGLFVNRRFVQGCLAQPVKEGDEIQTLNATLAHHRGEVAYAAWCEHFGYDAHTNTYARTCGDCMGSDPQSCSFMQTFRPWYRLRALLEKEQRTGALIIDTDRCSGCVVCKATCSRNAITIACRTHVGHPYPIIADEECSHCGQCARACKAGGIAPVSRLAQLLGWMWDENTILYGQFAPAITAAITSEFRLDPRFATIELVAELIRRCGFEYVLPTHVGAEIVTVYETAEIVKRLARQPRTRLEKRFQLTTTSCCSGHLRHFEQYARKLPRYLRRAFKSTLSTMLSPQEVVGIVLHRLAEQRLADKATNVRYISFMPCTEKEGEAARYDHKNTDLVVGATELVELIKLCGINVPAVAHAMATGKIVPPNDELVRELSGGSAIFARAGGVTEAVLRLLGQELLGRPLGPEDIARFTRAPLDQVPGLYLLTAPIPTQQETVFKVIVAYGGEAIEHAYGMIVNGRAVELGAIALEVMECDMQMPSGARMGGCVFGGAMPKGDRAFAALQALKTLAANDQAATYVDASGPKKVWINKITDMCGGEHAFHRPHTVH